MFKLIDLSTDSRRGFSRKLWRFDPLNATSTETEPNLAVLTYSSVDKVRADKEITFACNCANTLDSNMRIIHKMRALNKKQRKYLKLWSQGFTAGYY